MVGTRKSWRSRPIDGVRESIHDVCDPRRNRSPSGDEAPIAVALRARIGYGTRPVGCQKRGGRG